MPEVVCNKAKKYGCTPSTCYHSEPHEEYSECHTKCIIHNDDDVKCVEVK